MEPADHDALALAAQSNAWQADLSAHISSSLQAGDGPDGELEGH